jgi:hypothetical protein
MSIRYYDSADGRLLDAISEQAAENFLARGIARAIRTKNGKIARLYSIPRERSYSTPAAAVAAMHSDANETIDRIRDDNGAKTYREHRRPDSRTGSPRVNLPLTSIDICVDRVPDLWDDVPDTAGGSGMFWPSQSTPKRRKRTIGRRMDHIRSLFTD